ncbi:MAG: hypothetical protein UU32_C0025G0007 [Candidatus Woesebacteria bacterium GW2011_GWB1_41_10]|uniref:Uncharacterized protein n=1 Tax=Candidatus Woesebacteria bacterium GW2011_GWB1_41_10 TaxID=1618577 RepID=A0A0G0UAG2_9BACT|nr:MAG: hypothetical protein UU32_C0025G0007 [Candidatus Woesebacteria bacterium GW2011_GWB1_41_10]
MTSERSVGNPLSEISMEIVGMLAMEARDVPYKLGLDGDVKKLTKENLGNCARKCYWLIPRLRELRCKMALGLAEFNWNDLPIPREIVRLLKDPTDTHMFLYVDYGKGEKVLDIAWDPGMPSGFPINSWGKDGGEMKIGVPATRIHRVDYKLFHTRAMVFSSIVAVRDALTLRKSPTPFTDAFNAWLGR